MKPMLHVPVLLGVLMVIAGTVAGASSREAQMAALPLKLTNEVAPQFPVRLMKQGVTHGEAQALISVDQSGKILDCLVPRYTHKEFAEAVREAVKLWRFEPRDPKAPAGVVLDLTFEFEVRGVLTIERWAIDKAVSPADPAFEYVYQPCAAKDLDVPLKPVHLERPAFPEEFAKQGIRGTAVVDFYVDEQGRARIPVATQAQHDVLASLARQAVSQWQFQPPTRNGKPVLVKVSQRFAFTE